MNWWRGKIDLQRCTYITQHDWNNLMMMMMPMPQTRHMYIGLKIANETIFGHQITGNQNSSQPAQCGTSNIFRYQNHAVSAPHSAALWRSHLHDAHHLISGFHRHRILREWILARQTPKQCVVGILKGKAGKGGKDCKAWYSIKVVSGRRDTRLDSESSLCEHLCKNSAQDINPFVMQ